MKRLSIKARVTLWFTLFLTLLAALALGCLLAVGGQLTEQGSQDTLKRAVSRGLEELDWEHGQPDIDDDLKSYEDGVWLAVYDQSGCVMLRFENYCAQPVELGADGLPRHNTHGGYDLRGVQAAAQDHDGTMTLHWADGWFTLRILLPIPE